MKFTYNGIEWNELDWVFIVDYVIGISMFLGGILFDLIAQWLQIRHEPGFNLGQMIWCFGWGLYILWTYLYYLHYGE